MRMSATSQASVALVASIGLLGFGFLAKGWRYHADQPQQAAATFATVQKFMARHGWSPEKAISYRAGMPLTAEAFRKDGCPRSANIIDLGNNLELQSYVRLLYDDVVFVQDGHLLRDGSAWHHQYERFTRLGSRVFAGNTAYAMPILAVAPAPTDDACSPPGTQDWGRFNRPGAEFAP